MLDPLRLPPASDSRCYCSLRSLSIGGKDKPNGRRVDRRSRVEGVGICVGVLGLDRELVAVVGSVSSLLWVSEYW